jgi:hypothetical protein
MGRLLGILSVFLAAYTANVAYEWLLYGGGPEPQWRRVSAETVQSLYRNATYDYRSSDNTGARAYFRRNGTALKAFGLGNRLDGTWNIRDERLCITWTFRGSGTEKCWEVYRNDDEVMLWKNRRSYSVGTLRQGSAL